MLYNWVFGFHGNTCFDWCRFCMIHSIGPINVCTDFEINRYKIDEVRKYAKIVFYLTSSDAKAVRRTSWALRHWSIFFYQEHFWFKSYGSNSGFRVFGDLDLCSTFCHTHCAWYTGISMRSFIRIHPVLMADMPRTHTHPHIRRISFY